MSKPPMPTPKKVTSTDYKGLPNPDDLVPASSLTGAAVQAAEAHTDLPKPRPAPTDLPKPTPTPTFNVRLYHYIVDNGEYVSLFPAESPEFMDEMIDHGMVRVYKTDHQIKHNIKDKELEHKALELFHGEVAARTELTSRGFSRNWD